MPHEVEIDDDVYSVLAANARGFERPNDVLRRLVLETARGTESTSSRNDGRSATKGRLARLIDAGLIHPGDKLRHEQVRKGGVFTATVEHGGQIRTSNGLYNSPSPALVEFVGTQIDGWHNWTHVPTGMTLRELRSGLKGEPL